MGFVPQVSGHFAPSHFAPYISHFAPYKSYFAPCKKLVKFVVNFSFSTDFELNTGISDTNYCSFQSSLRRSRFLGCHATLPPRGERCVTSQKTAAKETTSSRVRLNTLGNTKYNFVPLLSSTWILVRCNLSRYTKYHCSMTFLNTNSFHLRIVVYIYICMLSRYLCLFDTFVIVSFTRP